MWYSSALPGKDCGFRIRSLIASCSSSGVQIGVSSPGPHSRASFSAIAFDPVPGTTWDHGRRNGRDSFVTTGGSPVADSRFCQS